MGVSPIGSLPFKYSHLESWLFHRDHSSMVCEIILIYLGSTQGRKNLNIQQIARFFLRCSLGDFALPKSKIIYKTPQVSSASC